jgi:hypothetical protein
VIAHPPASPGILQIIGIWLEVTCPFTKGGRICFGFAHAKILVRSLASPEPTKFEATT